MNTYPLKKPVPIPGSNFTIISLTKEGSPYMVRELQYTGYPELDQPKALSAIIYFTRLSEAGEDVPDFKDLEHAIELALNQGAKLHGEGFFGSPL